MILWVYAKDPIFLGFTPPWSSILAPSISQLSFLKVFKEFVLNDDDEEIIPDYFRIVAFLKCNCKISRLDLRSRKW